MRGEGGGGSGGRDGIRTAGGGAGCGGQSGAGGDLPPRVLGIDYGRKRVGLAVSDPLGIMAQPLPTIPFAGEDATIARVKSICEEREVARIVVGLPRNMDGSLGPMALEVQDFARKLEAATGLPVETLDERLTSFEAESRLAEAGMHWRERKRRVDQVAAAIILQSWLDRRGSAPPASGAPGAPGAPAK